MTHLDLRHLDLHKLSVSQWQALCAVLARLPQLQQLDLSWNDLHTLSDAQSEQ